MTELAKSVHDCQRPRAKYYNVQEENDPFPDPSLLQPDAGSDDKDAPSAAVKAMLERARANGFPQVHRAEFATLVMENTKAFQTSLSNKLAEVEPLSTDLILDISSVWVKHQSYSPDQRAFLKKLVSKLTQYGLVYPNPLAKWASAPLLVPEQGVAKWRCSEDLRSVNRSTVRHQSPIPDLEQELTRLASSKNYANLNFVQNYLQLPLHPDFQESQSFITPNGVYSQTRVAHGTTNAATHLLSCVTLTIPEELRSNILLWLDDCLVHFENIQHFLHCVCTFLAYFMN